MLFYSFNRMLLYTLLDLRGLVRQQWSLNSHPRLLFLEEFEASPEPGWGTWKTWVMWCFGFFLRTRPQLIKDVIFFSLALFFWMCLYLYSFFFFCTIQPLHNQRVSVEETSLLRKQAFITNKEAQKVLKIRYFQVEMRWAALVLILCFEDREGHITERSTQKQY